MPAVTALLDRLLHHAQLADQSCRPVFTCPVFQVLEWCGRGSIVHDLAAHRPRQQREQHNKDHRPSTKQVNIMLRLNVPSESASGGA